MKAPSRRHMLRSIAAVPFVSMFDVLNAKAVFGSIVTPPPPCSLTPPTLAVVFHGLFIFVFDAKHKTVDAVAPIVPGHVYWAGDYGQEDLNNLNQGVTYSLIGVQPGCWNGPFDFPYLPSISLDESTVHNRVLIPWPDFILFDREIAQTAPFFTQPSTLVPRRLPLIYAFVYSGQSISSRPELSGTMWQAPRTVIPGGAGIASLHVRAEHLVPNMLSNGWDVFNNVLSLTGTDQVVLNSTYQATTAPAQGIISGSQTLVDKSEDTFLSEEHVSHMAYMVNTAANCAAIGGGGCTPVPGRTC